MDYVIVKIIDLAIAENWILVFNVERHDPIKAQKPSSENLSPDQTFLMLMIKENCFPSFEPPDLFFSKYSTIIT